MKNLVKILLLSLTLVGCKKETIYIEPCINCEMKLEIDTNVTPGVYVDTNGYTHIPFNGSPYFTIQSTQSEIHESYVINGVPLVEQLWDSDYWVLFDTIRFQFPLYSILGNFNSNGTPISTSAGTYYFTNNQPPTNIAGYVYNSNKELGTKTQYDYVARKMYIMDNEMIGDTANMFVKGTWNGNNWSDETRLKKEVSKTMKVIFE